MEGRNSDIILLSIIILIIIKNIIYYRYLKNKATAKCMGLIPCVVHSKEAYYQPEITVSIIEQRRSYFCLQQKLHCGIIT